jgi:hypothetical protein
MCEALCGQAPEEPLSSPGHSMFSSDRPSPPDDVTRRDLDRAAAVRSSIGGLASSVLSADSRRRGRPKRPGRVFHRQRPKRAKARVCRRAAAHLLTRDEARRAHSRQCRQAAGAAEPVSEDKRGVTVGAAHSQCTRPKGSIALPAFSEIKRPPN